jgi:hypothetical protein
MSKWQDSMIKFQEIHRNDGAHKPGAQKTKTWNTDTMGWPCGIARCSTVQAVQTVVEIAKEICQPDGNINCGELNNGCKRDFCTISYSSFQYDGFHHHSNTHGFHHHSNTHGFHHHSNTHGFHHYSNHHHTNHHSNHQGVSLAVACGRHFQLSLSKTRCLPRRRLRAPLSCLDKKGVSLAVACGRHSHVSLPDGALVLDLSPMRKVEVDRFEQTATIQGGCLLSDVDKACQEYGLAVTQGHQVYRIYLNIEYRVYRV